MRIVGIDEAGRSPVLGPLIQAGVLCTSKDQWTELIDLDIKESKKLPLKKRDEIGRKILDWAQKEESYATIKAWMPRQIDSFVKEHGLNKLEAEGIGEIAVRLRADYIVMHRIQQTGLSEQHRKAIWDHASIPIEVVDNEEDNILVAAASILATWTRTTFMEHQRELHRFWGMTTGTGEPFNGKTREFIRTHPESSMIRKEWATFKKIMGESD